MWQSEVFFFNIYLFGWAGSLLRYVGSSCLIRDRTWVPALGSCSLSYWTTNQGSPVTIRAFRILVNLVQHSQHSAFRWGNWGSVTCSKSHGEEAAELWWAPRQLALSSCSDGGAWKSDGGKAQAQWCVMVQPAHGSSFTAFPPPSALGSGPSHLDWTKRPCSSNYRWVNQGQDLTQAGQIQLFSENLELFFKEMGFPGGAVVKDSPASAGDARDPGSIPGLGDPLE